MKRMFIASIIFGFISSCFELGMASSDYTSGTILTKTGDAVRASRFERDQKVRGIYKGREISANLASLKSLEVMDRDREGFKLKVENSDGKQLILSSGTVSSKYHNTADESLSDYSKNKPPFDPSFLNWMLLLTACTCNIV